MIEIEKQNVVDKEKQVAHDASKTKESLHLMDYGTLYSVCLSTKTSTLLHDDPFFNTAHALSIGGKFFGFTTKFVGRILFPTGWRKVTSLSQNSVRKQVLAMCYQSKSGSSLTSYRDEIIFVSGGFIMNHPGDEF